MKDNRILKLNRVSIDKKIFSFASIASVRLNEIFFNFQLKFNYLTIKYANKV